nr:hypothetical protein [Pseudobdellovibrionaceae bacterium]
MKRLDEFFQKYPLISLATSADQDKIFDLLERTSLKAGGLQIGFDRRPDFFTFLKNQGPKAFVFLMNNENGEVHGLACMSVRPMLKGTKKVAVAYASDLRTTPQLSRAARMQWRNMYADLIELLPTLPEFEQPEAVLTAVWNDNELAQRALVRKSSKLQVEYAPVSEYMAFSVLGRLVLKKSPYIREALPEDRDLIFKWICGPAKEN